MYELSKSFLFDAGHILIHHDGKCSKPHGHTYKLIVTIRSDKLIEEGPKKNMILDFGDVSKTVKILIESHLDHHWLNDTLETDSPTAEYIAKWIFEYLKKEFTELYSITLYETPTSFVTYTP